eukprot:14954882-Heterocapsa_arctica.AAC.1
MSSIASKSPTLPLSPMLSIFCQPGSLLLFGAFRKYSPRKKRKKKKTRRRKSCRIYSSERRCSAGCS